MSQNAISCEPCRQKKCKVRHTTQETAILTVDSVIASCNHHYLHHCCLRQTLTIQTNLLPMHHHALTVHLPRKRETVRPSLSNTYAI